MELKKGARVRTPQYGVGTILAVDGEMARVHIDQFSMEVRLPVTGFEVLPDEPRETHRTPPPSRPTPRPTEKRENPPGHSPPGVGRGKAPVPPSVKTPTVPAPAVRKEIQLRQDVEALRFGLVPKARLEDLTIGFSGLEDWIGQRLPHQNGGGTKVSEICGPFGTGKSHTAAVVRHVARKLNYLTARVEVDGRTVSLSDPERLLNSLWPTLVGPGLESATPIVDLYVKAAARTSLIPRVAPRGIDRVEQNYQVVRSLHRAGVLDSHAYELEALLESSDEFTANEVMRSLKRDGRLTFTDTRVYRMIGKSVGDRPYDFVESLAGVALAARLAGYEGLAVTIDEFEVESYALSPKMQMRAWQVLSVLREYLAGETAHRPAPIALFIATVGEEGHLGDAVVQLLVDGENDGRYRLRSMSRANRGTLARRIHSLYCDAYAVDDAFDPSLAEGVEESLAASAGDSDITRSFIKRYVGRLDWVYGPPH